MIKINQTLMKIKDNIKPLLLEVYPNMQEEIEFAYQDNFQEWFGMLFELSKWQLRPGMIDINLIEMSDSRIKEVSNDLKDYEGIKDYGFISAVEMDGNLHLIDGYHRVLVAKNIGISQIRGCIWQKNQNTHVNCDKIKKYIINNLG